MDVIKQYEDYIGLKKEYIKNPTLENKNAMIAKLEEYGKYIYCLLYTSDAADEL